MGPTRFRRGTHTAAEQRAFGGAARRGGGFVRAREGKAACGLLGTGEALLYDARVLHGGAANVGRAQPEAGAEAEAEAGGTRAAVASASADVRFHLCFTY